MIYIKDGAKMMRPIHSREEYMAQRSSLTQRMILGKVRKGQEKMKASLVQMNYSCLPNDDGSLRGSTRMTGTVGMDIDHIPAGEMESTKQRILAKKDELGLLMLEVSARGEGYHLAFRRKPELSQEENLKWASQLLGVKYDEGAKDITRVFFTTTDKELLFLDDELFKAEEVRNDNEDEKGNEKQFSDSLILDGKVSQLEYNGIPYNDIIRKWWELYNEGKEPVRSNRDVLTFELAVNLRHICGFDRQLMDAVIPCYDGFSETQKMKCIDSALGEKRTQMPKRLKDVLALMQAERETEDAANGAETEENSFVSLWIRAMEMLSSFLTIQSFQFSLFLPISFFCS